MAQRLLVVAADHVKDEESTSPSFLIWAGVMTSFDGLANTCGTLRVREDDPPRSPYWECSMGRGGRQVFTSGSSFVGEEGLRDLLKELPEGTLLVEKSILPVLKQALTEGMEMTIIPYDGELKTHYDGEELSRRRRQMSAN